VLRENGTRDAPEELREQVRVTQHAVEVGDPLVDVVDDLKRAGGLPEQKPRPASERLEVDLVRGKKGQ